jgi:hypothetical protein
MIHNSSSDPVLIKKISLKIWSLRDEIESRLQDKIDEGVPPSEDDILQIRQQYTKNAFIPDNVLNLKSVSELDNGEDEMAKAMAEMNSGEAAEEEVVEEAPEDTDKNTLPQEEPENKNVINISLNIPKIADEKISKGKTILSEISMDKMFFFCNKSFTEGQSIVIQFCIPKSFIINADILYCRTFNSKSRVISANNYTHRALIRFNFLKEGERALLRQFLQSIEPVFVKVDKKIDTSKESTDGSDFNELDDLGL